MARVSKYERMVGKIVNEVLVSNYRRTKMISKKSLKAYYKYEVEIENILWVSTTSFNKGSFMKRLAKAMKEKEVKNEIVVSRFNREESDTSSHTFKLTREMLKGNVYNVSDEIYEQALTTLFDVAYCKDSNGDLQSSLAFADTLMVDLDELELTNMIGDMMMEKVIKLYQVDRQEGLNWLRKFKAYSSPKKVIDLQAILITEPTEQPTEHEVRNPHIRVANMILFYEGLPLLQQWLNDNWQVYEARWEQFEEEFEELVRSSASVVENEFSKYFVNCKNRQEVKKQYRALAKQYHSDLGGNDETMAMINVAYEQALQMIA